MAHEIKKASAQRVEFSPPLNGKTSDKTEKFGVTDKAIGLAPGNTFEKGVASYEITGFGQEMQKQTGDRAPDVDHNPYNFVTFAGSQPWTLGTGGVMEHDVWAELNHGVIEFEIEALTPCFVPEGFPFPAKDKLEREKLQAITRAFCKMRNAGGELRYAIPGASLKGALRSAIEALSNSRLGVWDQPVKSEEREGEEYPPLPHVYRRRVFDYGIILTNPNKAGEWTVEGISFPQYGNGSAGIADYGSGLLAAQRLKDPPQKGYDKTGRTYRISARMALEYSNHIRRHPHFRQHIEDHHADYVHLTGTTLDELAELKIGDVVYCVSDSKGTVLNFGKNVNYLWPAKRSMADMARPFLPREKPKLDGNTDLAEYLFGFAGPHEDNNSHPFQGMLRFETLWGSETSKTSEQPAQTLRLAPLTGPQTRGKSRPLYLAPAPGGRAASYDDPKAELRGRKFYWPQQTPDNEIWPKHKFGVFGSVDEELRAEVRSQCPPPVETLPAGVKFKGRIHFTNLPPYALGALVLALHGDRTIDGESRHVFLLGKGKPRGLGTFQVVKGGLTLKAWAMAARYSSLTASPLKGEVDLTTKVGGIVGSFRDWCAAHAKLPVGNTPLLSHPHVKDYAKLHRWPERPSVKYYPVNFSQYSWLPNQNQVDGEPRSARPWAMKRARDL